MLKKEIKNQIKSFIFNLSNRPSYVTVEDINVELEGYCLDIIMFGNYHIHLNLEEPIDDSAFCDCGGAYGYYDLLYAAEIMKNRDEILEMVINK